VKVFHIPPPALAKHIIPTELDAHLAIANVVTKNMTYAGFYQNKRRRDHWITVDTAAFEGEATTPFELFTAARRVRADEVVLPDVFKEAELTLEASTEALAVSRHHPFTGQFMVVPHGKTFHEYLWCLAELLGLSDQVKCIGIIEEVDELFNMDRALVVDMIHKQFPEFQIHLLGISESLQELYDLSLCKTVRSCDTAKFVVWGLNSIRTSPKRMDKQGTPAYPGRASLGGRMKYFDLETCEREQQQIIRRNILDVTHHLEAM